VLALSAAGGGSSPLSNFVKVRKLGEGGFGKVYLVTDRRDSQPYVMKEVDLTKLDAKGRKEATKECAFLARMSHPNIISYKEWFEVAAAPAAAAGPWGAAAWQQKGARPPAAGPAMLYIVMSYADGGDLEARIKVQQKLSGAGRIVPFPEQQIIDWFIQTALAIKHIHDRKILHRDIKTQVSAVGQLWCDVARRDDEASLCDGTTRGATVNSSDSLVPACFGPVRIFS
jgi:NIMA (never in mitosis gene a)-related kinase